MDLFRNWDDLVHGSAVFAGLLPFLTAGLLASVLPARWSWAACAVALVAPLLWCFGPPGVPPRSSEDALPAGLAVAAGLALLGAPSGRRTWALGLAGLVAWAALVWSLDPAWLAGEGGLVRRSLVSAGFAVVTVAWLTMVGELVPGPRESGGVMGTRRAPRHCGTQLSPATWVAPSVALAILSQLGGTTRFAQSAGALAAAAAGIGVAGLWRGADSELDGAGQLGWFWSMLAAQIAWCGWLFAEVRWGLAVALAAAPAAALLARLLPLPRGKAWQAMLWDFLAAAAVAAVVAGIALAGYLAESAAGEGY
jgi:hypothetical protein